MAEARAAVHTVHGSVPRPELQRALLADGLARHLDGDEAPRARRPGEVALEVAEKRRPERRAEVHHLGLLPARPHGEREVIDGRDGWGELLYRARGQGGGEAWVRTRGPDQTAPGSTHHDLVPGPHIRYRKVGGICVLQTVLLDRPHALVLAAPGVDFRAHVPSQHILPQDFALRRPEGGQHSCADANGSAGAIDAADARAPPRMELRLGTTGGVSSATTYLNPLIVEPYLYKDC